MKERDYRNLATFECRLIEVLDDIAIEINDLVVEVREFRAIFKPKAQSATLRIQGENMPATVLVGKTAQASWQEWSSPNGTGDKLPAAGAVTFSSSDPAVTVDPSSGLITVVAMATAPVTISGSDAANGLTASDTVTTAEVAQSATLTVTAN